MILGPPTGTGSQKEKEEGTETGIGTETTTTNVPEDEWTSVHKVPRRRRPQRGRRRNHQTKENTTCSSGEIPSKPLKAGYWSSSVYTQNNNNNNNNNNSDSIANEEIYNSLNICLRELKESEYWRNIKQLLLKMRLDDDDVDDDDRRYSNSNCKLFQSIVCYGIGNFGTTRSSAPLWQLALAVTIRDYIRTLHTHNDNDDETSLEDDDHASSSSLSSTLKSTSNKNNDDDHRRRRRRRRLPTMYYFEPLMTVEESIILEKLDIHIIAENERGGRSVIDEQGGCLFFMPHCPMTLYTNLLHANWDCLRENNILIFGNSLSSYIDGGGNNSNNNNIDITNTNNPQKRQALDILKDLQPHWEEERLDISKNDISDRPAYFERAFNDSSFTSFRRTVNIAADSATETKTQNSCWPKRPQLLDTSQSDDGGEVL